MAAKTPFPFPGAPKAGGGYPATGPLAKFPGQQAFGPAGQPLGPGFGTQAAFGTAGPTATGKAPAAAVPPKGGIFGKAPGGKSAAALAAELGDLSKWLKHKQGDLGSFQVVVDVAVIRTMPSVKSNPRGRLKKGDIVEGEIRSEWLLLNGTGNGEPQGLDTGEGEWLLIDGTSLNIGVGVVAKRVLVDPEVRREFGTALEVGLPPGEKSNQMLEVKPASGEVRNVTCPPGRILLIRDLPCDCNVKLRFFLRDSGGGALAVSQWVEGKTQDLKPFEEGDEPELDLVGNPRGKCGQCDCPAYAPDNEGVGQNFQLTEARCLRCGCNVAAHAIMKPEEPPEESKAKSKDQEKGQEKPKSSPKPKPPPEPLLIDKAIALPKETMMARWRALDVPAGQQAWPRLPKHYRELVAWSDLHADMGQNMEHLERLPEAPETVLLLAGDLATNLEIMESSFRMLKEKFGEVFYVPGNHELWVNKKEGLSSVHKFLAILELCERLEVRTRPAFISDDCAVCPLFSWYKDNLVDGYSREKSNIPFDIQTSWPWDITGRGDTNDAQQHEIADWFAALNNPRLQAAPKEAVEALQKATTARANEDSPGDEEPGDKVAKKAPEALDSDTERVTVVTMSHFVPRQECYPGPRRLCNVMGCREIEEQVRSCGASCHVFGHSHIAIDRVVDHVRYVQHPLGYPTDYHRKSKPMRVWAETSAAKGRDPAIAHKIALAEDGKWLVWNTVWGAANSDLADATEGPASEQYRSKSREDMERAAKHFKALKDAGNLELQSVQRLRDQARFGGRASAASVKAGEPLDPDDIEPIKPPAELESTLWESMLGAVKLAAQAVAEQCLDAFLLRKGNEVFNPGPGDWHKMKHHEPGKKLEKDFEKHWADEVAPDPLQAAEAAQEGPKKKVKDPAKMREIALGGDAKWLVWNTVWYATNQGLADHHKGPARDQYLEKANEDLERREEHVRKIRATGALSEAVLSRLQEQAEKGGFAAAANAKVGKEMPPLEVKALEAPPDIDAKQWTHMVRCVRVASQSTTESSLDAYHHRKGNERWEMNRENYHLCPHFHKAGIIQKRFESWWHNHVAPDPGENWEGASGIPEATLTGGIVKEFQEQIRECKEQTLERPPGRWQNKGKDGYDSGDIFSSAKEAELRAEEEGAVDETELWSTTKPSRDLEVQITNLEDPTQRVAITISNEMLVRNLKEAIVEKVGRGPVSKITLSTSGENRLDDDTLLSSVEEEVEQGVMLLGIDLSEGRLIDVQVVHAASDTPQSLVITIMDNSTILEVRRAIKAQLQERALSACKLVKQMGNAFSSLKDDEKLNGRTELLFLGRDLPAGLPGQPGQPGQPGPASGKAGGSTAAPKLEVASSKPASTPEPRPAPRAPPVPAAPEPTPVVVSITHATAGCTVDLTVRSDCTCGDVRKALMAHLGETRLSQVKLVRRQAGGVMVSLGDSDELAGRTSLLCMGREWGDSSPCPASPAAAESASASASAEPKEEEAPQPPAPVQQQEMTVAIIIDRDMDLKSEIQTRSGTSILKLKEQIAADDPTGSTSVDQFGLKLAATSTLLSDDTLLTPEMTEFEIALAL